jgi:hypothetical protein
LIRSGRRLKKYVGRAFHRTVLELDVIIQENMSEYGLDPISSEEPAGAANNQMRCHPFPNLMECSPCSPPVTENDMVSVQNNQVMLDRI